MVNLDVNQVIRKAMQGQLEHFKEEFKEELRILQEAAWEAGARAAEEDPYGCKNPYSKENDAGNQVL